MPSFKTMLVIAAALALMLSLAGCGMVESLLTGREDEAVAQDGDLPEWLLLSYRSDEGPEDDDPLYPKDREDEDEDAAPVGGVDEDLAVPSEEAPAQESSSRDTTTARAPEKEEEPDDRRGPNFTYGPFEDANKQLRDTYQETYDEILKAREKEAKEGDADRPETISDRINDDLNRLLRR